MKTEHIISTVSAILALLFAYTATDKLLDFETFRGQMLNQPLSEMLSIQLAWAVPLAEVATVVLMATKRSRLLGLWCALLLMTVFTLYVALVLFHAFERVPCSCGGFMESLSWEEYLVVNVLFWAMALTGVILETKKTNRPIGPVS